MAEFRKLKTKDLLDIDFYSTKTESSKDLEDLMRVRARLAKLANERLRKLENTTSQVTGETYTYGAYDSAMEYLQSKSKRRFSEATQLTKKKGITKSKIGIREAKREIAELQNFLTSKSSTIKGMRQAESKRIRTFTSGRGKVQVSPEIAGSKDFYNFLKSQAFKDASKGQYASEQLVEFYERARTAGSGVSHEEVMHEFTNWLESAQMGEDVGITDLYSQFGLNYLEGSRNV